MLSSPHEAAGEAAARRRLGEMAGLAATLREGLLAAHESLPVSPREDLMLLGEEDVDFATEARRTIECALADHLDPLIRSLQAVAEDRR
ncbi:MAG TPA: hypothetical protein VKM72_04985 [Thermoanaerobaculia bacterium]|nr:hypothetical protein [Thermoanaerobaculia bacterium]